MPEERVGKRRHPRIDATLNVRISTIEPDRDPWTGKPFFRASQERCANLSRGGVFVRTSEPLAPGRRILLELHLPSGDPLEAIGRVAWTRRIMSPHASESEAGIGVEFLGGARDQFSALEAFIDTRTES
jgi:uncharacterized protein (TIGR02266 family)